MGHNVGWREFEYRIMVGVSVDQSNNNGIIEKYCYDNNQTHCESYGGLYQWEEAMQYSTSGTTRFADGWHIPTDFEWDQLEGQLINMIIQILNGTSMVSDVGSNVKSTTGWNSSGNGTDDFDFYYSPIRSKRNKSWILLFK
ncbi:MAG: FISUMP domain-containing protein [Bacteroidales bacterium]